MLNATVTMQYLSDRSIFIVLFLGVLLSRIPFIGNGYGIDPDSWRVASVAHAIYATHQYVASRLPGYPVQEITYALIPTKQAAVFNFLTAALSSLCAVYVAKSFKLLRIKQYVLASIAFILTPIVYINSTNSMDYIWALCFIFISIHSALRKKYSLSGIFLGVAVGCRITSAAMLIPLIFIIVFVNTDTGYKIYAKLFFSFATTCLIIFFPVYTTYGLQFFSYFGGGIPFLNIIKNISVDVWGIVGCFSIIICVILFMFGLSDGQRRKEFFHDRVNQLSILVIIEYGIIFSFAPFEAGYLIPIVPFVILLLVHNTSTTLSTAFTCTLAASSFLVGINTADMPWSVKTLKPSYTIIIGQRPIDINLLYGPIIEDRMQRIARDEYVKKVIKSMSRMDSSSVLVCGVWFTQLAVELNKHVEDNIERFNHFEQDNVIIRDVMDKEMSLNYQKQNVSIYYLTGQDKNNFNVYGFSLRSFDAKEIIF